MNSQDNLRYSGNLSIQSNEFESPFLDRFEPNTMESVNESTSSIWHQSETPFLSNVEYESIDGTNPRIQMITQLLGELEDEEFEEAISNLTNEASAIYEDKLSHEYGDSKVVRSIAEEETKNYLSPLIHNAELLLEAIEQRVIESDISTMNESQIHEFFEQFETNNTNLSPEFEEFLGGLVQKAKKLASGALNLAQKVSPVGDILKTALEKLKKLVRPLLDRVLKVAMGKLPIELQPAAQKLANKLLGTQNVEFEFEGEFEFEDNEDTATSNGISFIQKEFDIQLVNSLLSEEEEFEYILSEYEVVSNELESNELETLQQARNEFIEKINELKDGEDSKPAMEEFIPAILPALKIGMKMIGRPKVINFLSGILSKLVSRFIGPEMAQPLSKAIVDSGLKLINLEINQESQMRAGASAIASTVEETINNLSQIPETVFEDFELLEAFTLEAFDKSVSSNFPADVLKAEYREASTNGSWVLMPFNSNRKYYKKYTMVFDRRINPSMTSKLITFGDIQLNKVLRDQYNIDFNQEFDAKVHIYEAIPGTWLSRISKFEDRVPGLGSPNEQSWSQLHPLTTQSAAVILGEPGLGKDVNKKFLMNRNLIAVGQRFYYLEVVGKRPIVQPNPRPNILQNPRKIMPLNPRVRRSSDFFIRINCPRNYIKIAIYLSEVDSQSISQKIRQNVPLPFILRSFIPIFSVKDSLINKIRIIHESVSFEELSCCCDKPNQGNSISSGFGKGLGNTLIKSSNDIRPRKRRLPPYLIQMIRKRVITWVLKRINDFLNEKKAEFIKATESPEDGVTIIITLINPPLIPLICNTLNGNHKINPKSDTSGIPDARVQIFPGFVRTNNHKTK